LAASIKKLGGAVRANTSNVSIY